jgi:hypothetical protein
MNGNPLSHTARGVHQVAEPSFQLDSPRRKETCPETTPEKHQEIPKEIHNAMFHKTPTKTFHHRMRREKRLLLRLCTRSYLLKSLYKEAVRIVAVVLLRSAQMI